MARLDVIIVGAGPAGSVAAAHCAQGGRSVLVLEKSCFPRDKVCGDCLNPSCWPILERLELAGRVRQLPHAALREVHIAGLHGEPIALPLPQPPHDEIAVKRYHFDQLLLTRAIEASATVRDGTTVTKISAPTHPDADWEIRAGDEVFHSRWLIAADGRNSTVARLLGLLPPLRPERVGFQTHFPLPSAETRRVTMRFLPAGYCGLADVGEGVANLCLVAIPRHADALKAWATEQFHLPPDQAWRSITPLRRTAIDPMRKRLFLVGDAARVVEPFTGEGIYYAMASGDTAARHLLAEDPAGYARAHRRLYRGRLWVNQLARAACLHPTFAASILAVGRQYPSALAFLMRRIIR